MSEGFPLSPIDFPDQQADPDDLLSIVQLLRDLSSFRIRRLFFIPLTVTVSHTIEPESERIILANASPITVTLPAAANADGVFYAVKKLDVAASNVTVATPGAETIDGAASFALTTQYQSVFVISDGSNYWII